MFYNNNITPIVNIQFSMYPFLISRLLHSDRGFPSTMPFSLFSYNDLFVSSFSGIF
nr:MAG TPA: hypothetical protein [Caudoviricetes sp.]